MDFLAASIIHDPAAFFNLAFGSFIALSLPSDRPWLSESPVHKNRDVFPLTETEGKGIILSIRKYELLRGKTGWTRSF